MLPEKVVAESDIIAQARAAGLDKAVDKFPQDVQAAAQAAEQARKSLRAPDDATVEPWPPMRASTAQ
jgi:phage-related minor tail protein